MWPSCGALTIQIQFHDSHTDIHIDIYLPQLIRGSHHANSVSNPT